MKKQKPRKRGSPKPQPPVVIQPVEPASRSFDPRQFFGGVTAVLTAIALYSGLSTVWDLADWARWFTDRWQAINESFWRSIFRVFGATLIPEGATVFTIMIFMVALAISAMIAEDRQPPKPKAVTEKKGWKVGPLDPTGDWHSRVMEGVTAGLCATFVFACLIEITIFKGSVSNILRDVPWVYWAFPILVAISAPMLVARYGSARYLQTWGVGLLCAVVFFVMAVPSARKAMESGAEGVQFYRKVVLAYLVAMLPFKAGCYLAMAKPYYLLVRLSWVVIVLAALLGLSWISTMGISIKAPAQP